MYREWLQLPPSLMTVKEAVLLIQRLAYIQERYVEGFRRGGLIMSVNGGAWGRHIMVAFGKTGCVCIQATWHNLVPLPFVPQPVADCGGV